MDINVNKFYKSRKNILCGNCGRKGHMYKSCKFPIESYGIICIKQTNNGPRYLLIRRKNSLGYVEIIRGKYHLDNIGYLRIMFSIMSTYEKRSILYSDFKILWDNLWINRDHNEKYNQEFNEANIKFQKLKENGIQQNGTKCLSLNNLIEESGNLWKEPEWGFPKGRKNFKEIEIDCAKREFTEETGIPDSDLEILDYDPFTELFVGTNGVTYKHNYYIAKYIGNNYNIVVDKLDLNQFAEVGKIQWVSYNEAMKKIRDYSIEKLSILNKINSDLLPNLTFITSKQ